MPEFLQSSPKDEYIDQTVIEQYNEQDPDTGLFQRITVQADGAIFVKNLEESKD